MAKKSSPRKKNTAKSNDSNVVRIKATETPAPKQEKASVEAAIVTKADTTTTKQQSSKRGIRTPRVLRAIGGYFKGAWVELRQVRWPTRRATWGLTGAVLLYTAFFIAVILLLDALFQYLFELILGK